MCVVPCPALDPRMLAAVGAMGWSVIRVVSGHIQLFLQ